MGTTVDDLLRLPFSDRNCNEKMKIVLNGKPRPSLNWCTVNVDGQRKVFDKASYEHVSWLTGSAQRQNLFCWPCLLFQTIIKGIWNHIGAFNSPLLLEYMYTHENTSAHIQASLDLQLFMMQSKNSANIPVSKLEPVLQTRAEVISRNRKILKHLIDLVCNCVAKKQTPGSGNYSRQLEIEDCMKMLQFVRNYTCKINEIDSAIKLIKDSPKFFNDIVDSITEVMKNSIKKDVQMSTYVSLILSKHSDTADKSQISTILRYLKNGIVCEKFVGFFHLEQCTAANVYQHVSKVISTFNISEKFLAYSLDGGILQTCYLSDFVIIMKNYHKFTFFVPWYAHELEQVLRQSLSNVKEFNIFFKILTAIENFLQKHSKRWKAFEKLVGVAHFVGNFAPSSSRMWFIRSETTKVVCSYRRYFIEFFDSILRNCERWDAEDIAQVSGFQQYLKEFHTVFLLHVFSTMFELTLNFSLYLKTKTPEQVLFYQTLDDLKNILRTGNGQKFAQIWINVLADSGAGSSISSAVQMQSVIFPSTIVYIQQFQKITNLIVCAIDARFDELRSLEFCRLLTRRVYTCSNTHVYYIEKLQRAHGQYFEKDKILKELRVLKAYASIVPKGSIQALFHFFVKTNLRHAFPSLYQLAELTMTLPFRRSPNGGGAAEMKKIANWAYITEEDVIAGDVSMLCVELDYLKELKKVAFFYDEVIAKFFEVNKTIELF